MDDDVQDRARRHAALGEPIRLAIVDDLSVTDRSPKEIGERFDLPTNLLAHHLDVLERAGLIERFVSAGDRRRRYVRLIAEPTVRARPRVGKPPAEVLFVCTHNSARSQLAAALWTAQRHPPASSAGTHPADQVHAGAVAAARRMGLDLSAARPMAFEAAVSDEMQVITVCDQAHEELAAQPSWWHWSIPDPVAVGGAAAFDAAATQLDHRIRSLE